MGITTINRLMFAGDLVIFCPYSGGLQQLLMICSQYGLDHDIKCNAKKSNIMTVRTKEDGKLLFADFALSACVFKVCAEVNYSGRYITEDLSDDRDIYRLCASKDFANLICAHDL